MEQEKQIIEEAEPHLGPYCSPGAGSQTVKVHVPRAQRARNAALTSFSGLVLRRATRAYGTRPLHQHAASVPAGAGPPTAVGERRIGSDGARK